jgi:hypothetical protein
MHILKLRLLLLLLLLLLLALVAVLVVSVVLVVWVLCLLWRGEGFVGACCFILLCCWGFSVWDTLTLTAPCSRSSCRFSARRPSHLRQHRLEGRSSDA